MDLAGTLSNHALRRRLGALSRELPRVERSEALRACDGPLVQATRRASNVVGHAVVEALGALGGGASVGAVHRAVETELAGPVARSSVRSYLQRKSAGPGSPIRR